MEKDESYWNDYTEFINHVEKLTNLNPSDLLNRYKELIENVEEVTLENQTDFNYELTYEILIREDIEKVLSEQSLINNKLYDPFKKNIEELDLKLKAFITNSEEISWWKAPKLKL